ncbi:MAG: hypoxanthine phosphoribosyltransferase [Candidatus Eremiobacteraeota bacterium]|nr:hypoxanthine phosphoribosyltransferase [Candidatus Eremiobacteraeota bacterium]
MIGDPLFDTASIAGRVAAIAADISNDYLGRTPLMIGLSTGAVPFHADLASAVTIPRELDYLAVTNYGDGDGIALDKDVTTPIEGRHVILVDDSVDTGLTLQYVVKRLLERAPASLAVCTLLDRPHRRIADVEIKYRAFEAPDVYLVGYGLDYLGRYRELPALYAHGTWPQ